MTQSHNPIHQPEALEQWQLTRAAEMLSCYAELVKITGRYAEEHYIPEIEELAKAFATQPATPIPPESAAVSSADWEGLLNALAPTITVYGREGVAFDSGFRNAIEAVRRLAATPQPSAPAETGEVARLAEEAKHCAELYASAVAGQQSTGLVPHQTLIDRGAALYTAIDRLRDLAYLAQPQVAASPALQLDGGFHDGYADGFDAGKLAASPALAPDAAWFAVDTPGADHDVSFALTMQEALELNDCDPDAASYITPLYRAALAASPLVPTVAERVPLTERQINDEITRLKGMLS